MSRIFWVILIALVGNFVLARTLMTVPEVEDKIKKTEQAIKSGTAPPGTQAVLEELRQELKAIRIQDEVSAKPKPVEEDYALVLKDIETLPPEERYAVRYLSLHNIKPDLRNDYVKVISFVLNHLSWARPIQRAQVVLNTNTGLVRFNVLKFCRNQQDFKNWVDAWEGLVGLDPYFREPWVKSEEAAALRAQTLSNNAILRADFFIYYSIRDDNPQTKAIDGFYSKFLGIPGNDQDFYNMLRVRLADVVVQGSDLAAVVVNSGNGNEPAVAMNNRRVTRVPTITSPNGGYLYETFDVFSSTGRQNFIENYMPDEKDHAGSEKIGKLPNAFNLYYLSGSDRDKNGSRKQVNEVPIRLAHDNMARDRIVKNAVSCIICHRKGIQLFVNDMQEMLKRGQVVVLTDPYLANRVTQLYDVDWEKQLKSDQDSFEYSVELATGWEAVKATEVLDQAIQAYEKPVDPLVAAWEFGIEVEALPNYFVDKVASTTQGSLLRLATGLGIARDTFEEEFKNGKLLQTLREQYRDWPAPTNTSEVPPEPAKGSELNPETTGSTELLESPTEENPKVPDSSDVEEKTTEAHTWMLLDENGKQYGPLDASVFEEWGKANRLTGRKVKRNDWPDWRPYSVGKSSE